MWELDQKESWVSKNWCFWTVVLEKTLESPLDFEEIKLVNPIGYQPWIFIGRTDAEAEAPILWPPDAKNQLIGEDPDTWKDWRQKEKSVAEDEMVEWHHWLNRHEFEQTPRHSEGQRSLVGYSPWGHTDSDTTEQLNNNYPLPLNPKSGWTPWLVFDQQNVDKWCCMTSRWSKIETFSLFLEFLGFLTQVEASCPVRSPTILRPGFCKQVQSTHIERLGGEREKDSHPPAILTVPWRAKLRVKRHFMWSAQLSLHLTPSSAAIWL